MKAKEYLQSVRRADTMADKHIRRLERYREAAGYGTGVKEAMRTSGTSQRSRVEDNICAMIDYEREQLLMTRADRAVDRYVDSKDDAIAIISKIPREAYREVLYRYYIDGLTWVQVSEQMGIGLRRVHKLHGIALIVFDRLWQPTKAKNTTDSGCT